MAITKNIYKYKVSFRQPEQELIGVQKAENRLLGTSDFMLLENQIQGKLKHDKRRKEPY